MVPLFKIRSGGVNVEMIALQRFVVFKKSQPSILRKTIRLILTQTTTK